jgi:flagellum-specific peptidoglycan hydrolase FlgJ
MEECFADRDRIIANVSCYAGARACSGDPQAFVHAFGQHWATDPQYAEKLLRVYRDNHLDEFDREFLNSSETQPQTAALTADGATNT